MLDAGWHRRKSQLLRDHVRAEIALADKEGRDEDSALRYLREDIFNLWVLFPKRLAHFRENFSPPEFRGVLINGRSRVRVPGRAVAEQHESGVGKIIVWHAQWLAQPLKNRNYDAG